MANLERLGASDEWGDFLLWLLEQAGWRVAKRPALGAGVLVVAHRRGVIIQDEGERVADVALRILKAAVHSSRPVTA